MPKSRKHNSSFVGRKAERRLKNVAAMTQAAQVKILVEQLPNQHAYDAFLLQCSDPERRRKMYDFTKGFCRFPDPQFPSTLKAGGLVGPDGRPL